MISKGTCPGPDIWTCDAQGLGHYKLAAGTSITINGVGIDPSHHIMWHRGAVYCLLCGAYGTKRPKGLATTCLLKTKTAKAKKVRNDMMEGIFPKGGSWPLPEGAPIPKGFGS